MPTTHLPPRVRRVLRSRLVDALTVPHGLGPYLEVLNPLWALDETRAAVTAIDREAADVVTVTLRVPTDFRHEAGQYLRFSPTIEGRRRTRSYSISSSADRRDGHVTITVKRMAEGLVSGHVHGGLRVGDVVTISAADGELTIPSNTTHPVLLVSGGSGITPVMAILRTLVARGHRGRVAFLHYTPTLDAVPFRAELEAIDAVHPNVDVVLVPTDEPSSAPISRGLTGFLSDDHLAVLDLDLDTALVRACGPLGLTDAVSARWEADGRADRLRIEAFEARRIEADLDAATGTITFAASGVTIANDGRTLLDQAEAAGLQPESGCRMGICQSCVLVKHCGPVKDARTGEISQDSDEQINPCIAIPLGDVDIDL